MEILIIFAIAWAVVRRKDDIAAGSRSGPSGGPRVAKYGMWDHLRDSYRDSWMRETDALVARRDARAARRAVGPHPTPGWWRRRWEAAEDRYAERRRAKRERRAATTTEPTPQPEPAKTKVRVRTGEGGLPGGQPTSTPEPEATPEPQPAVPDPEPATEPAAAPASDAPPATSDVPPPDPQPVPAAPSTTTSNGGTTMTGEVVNFEQHEAELEARIRDAEETIELASATVANAESLQASLDALEAKYGPLAQATQTRADHLAGMHIDADTKGHAATQADLLPPNRVVQYMDEIGGVKATAEAIRDAAEAAKAAAEEELANIRRRYADANETVQSDLSGDPGYLGNGGGAPAPTPAPAPEPVGAAA